MRIGIAPVLLIIGVCALSPAGAAFLDGNMSPRAVSQGDAFTAADDDASVIFYNPAGTAFLESAELGLMYNKPFMGLDQVDLSREYCVLCVPAKTAGSFSAGWSEFQGNGIYTEDSFIFSYAADLSRLVSARKRKIFSAGVSAKYLTHSYVLDDRTRNDPVFRNGQSKGAATADIGVLYRAGVTKASLLNIALSARNVVPADVGLKDPDVVPLETRFGASYYMDAIPRVNCLTAALDVVQRSSALTVHAGAECWVTSGFGVRVGGNEDGYAVGLSGDFGFKGFGVRLDYAFLMPLKVQETGGSHTLALVLRL